jgi:tryptophan-rich sensory protein
MQGIAVAVPLLGGIAGSVATADQIKTWYQTINKPSWTPPVGYEGSITCMWCAYIACSSNLVIEYGSMRSCQAGKCRCLGGIAVVVDYACMHWRYVNAGLPYCVCIRDFVPAELAVWTCMDTAVCGNGCC